MLQYCGVSCCYRLVYLYHHRQYIRQYHFFCIVSQVVEHQTLSESTAPTRGSSKAERVTIRGSLLARLAENYTGDEGGMSTTRTTAQMSRGYLGTIGEFNADSRQPTWSACRSSLTPMTFQKISACLSFCLLWRMSYCVTCVHLRCPVLSHLRT